MEDICFRQETIQMREIKEGLMLGLIVEYREPTEDVEETAGNPEGEPYWSMVRPVTLGEKPPDLTRAEALCKGMQMLPNQAGSSRNKYPTSSSSHSPISCIAFVKPNQMPEGR